ncbi:helix-turn-helix domain-containing protein [Pseudomonas sp. UFMG81]|uniref:helix-turn-helix domain-containing protein n=1 Tax=Pseudomonas sp. UFMG81 TaxID=2745936 RepID=UPI001E2CD1C3|nr:helix-turn-helix domain-containing protein [Pseudomonas sp. UFMG81]
MDSIASQPTAASDLSRHALLPHLQITTDTFPTWRQTADLLFSPVTGAGQGFSAALQIFHFQRFLLCSGRLDAARYDRNRARLGWCDLDHYLLHMPLQRGLACANGLRVRARDVVVLDLAQPAAFGMAAGEGLSLLIPRTALLAQDMGQMHGLHVRGASPTGRLLASLLSALAVAAPGLTQGEALRLSQPLLGMLAACLASAQAGQHLAQAPGPCEIGRRARLYIEGNLHRDDLTPAMLAKAVGTSRSQLYRAFERFGGVRHYLLQRRLRRCLLALGEPANAGRRIGDLAYAHGFVDEAHFSKVFRQAFGLSPRAARSALQRGELGAVARQGSAGSALARWVAELASQ